MRRPSASIGAALILAATACGSGEPTYQEMANAALDSASLKGVDASYDESERVVHVKGTVGSEADRRRAGDLVRQAIGTGALVANEVTVQGGDREMANDLDAGIETRLKNLVQADSTLSKRDRRIDFGVNNGVVTITGAVVSQAEKERVSKLARGVPGARDVVNALEVLPAK